MKEVRGRQFAASELKSHFSYRTQQQDAADGRLV